jgi:hypothetical protein
MIALCDEDLSVLIKSGKPKQNELEECWEELLEQYSQAIGGGDLSAKITDVKEYTSLKSRINIGYSLMQVVAGGRVSDGIIQQLYQFGYPLPPFNEDNIQGILGGFEGYLKRDIVMLNKIEKRISKASESKEKPKREDFYNMLTAIAEFMGPVLKESETTVAYYCSMVKRYNEKVQFEMNKKQKWQQS